MTLRHLLQVSSLLLLAACNDMDTRPETADKLKPIAVQVNAPTAADPEYKAPVWGETVRLDFHFIAPPDFPGLTATAELASPAPLTVPAPVPVILGAPEVDRTWPGLQHIIVHTSVQLPTLEVMSAIEPAVAQLDLLRFRYALTISDGTRQVPITGDFPAYRSAASPGASWNLFRSGITEPANGSEAGQTVAIKSEIVNPQNELLKIGWYVSDGEIKNRRAADTEWKLPGSGQYTLVFTVRGKQSRNGVLGFRTVTIP